MPLPKPKPDEEKGEFIERCMSDETMKKEYSDNDQRLAVCHSQWEKKEKESSAKYYEIHAKEKDDEAEILLYGDIGTFWFEEGNTAKQFVEDLKAVKNARQLSIRINSGGGSVFDGMAIFNAIDRHSAQKTVYIDGLAASIASVIAMAGESIIIAENGIMMIHKPFGGVLGNATEMRKIAEALDKIEEGMITSYQRKSKLQGNEIGKMMADETWMTAKEALEKGFVTQIGKKMEINASLKFDLKNYRNVPKDIRNLLGLPSDGPEASNKLFEKFESLKQKWTEGGIFKSK